MPSKGRGGRKTKPQEVLPSSTNDTGVGAGASVAGASVAGASVVGPTLVGASGDGDSDDQLAAWNGLVAVHSRLAHQLEAELVAGHGLPLVEFHVLAQLASAAGPIRMSTLAASSSLSRSGLTRVVHVLEGQGLVTRAPDGTDGRVIRASISGVGRDRLAQASATRSASLASFLAPLSPKQIRSLGKVWAALLDPAAVPSSQM